MTPMAPRDTATSLMVPEVVEFWHSGTPQTQTAVLPAPLLPPGSPPTSPPRLLEDCTSRQPCDWELWEEPTAAVAVATGEGGVVVNCGSDNGGFDGGRWCAGRR